MSRALKSIFAVVFQLALWAFAVMGSVFAVAWAGNVFKFLVIASAVIGTLTAVPLTVYFFMSDMLLPKRDSIESLESLRSVCDLTMPWVLVAIGDIATASILAAAGWFGWAGVLFYAMLIDGWIRGVAENIRHEAKLEIERRQRE